MKRAAIIVVFFLALYVVGALLSGGLHLLGVGRDMRMLICGIFGFSIGFASQTHLYIPFGKP